MAARDVGFDAQASAQRIVTSLMSCTLDVPPAATAISTSEAIAQVRLSYAWMDPAQKELVFEIVELYLEMEKPAEVQDRFGNRRVMLHRRLVLPLGSPVGPRQRR